MALWQRQQLQPHLSYTLVLLQLQLGMYAHCVCMITEINSDGMETITESEKRQKLYQ